MRIVARCFLGSIIVLIAMMVAGPAFAEIVVPGSTMSDSYGSRGGQHMGDDWAAPEGSPIITTTDGTVIEAGPASGFGNWIRIQQDDGHVVDAWSVGTMFRGFEQILVGRGAFDGLVVTPRICGICSTTHLMAAAQALDAVAKVRPPGNAIRLRNLALMAETVQSDVRQSVLMFLVDFANPAYANYRFHAEVGCNRNGRTKNSLN